MVCWGRKCTSLISYWYRFFDDFCIYNSLLLCKKGKVLDHFLQIMLTGESSHDLVDLLIMDEEATVDSLDAVLSNSCKVCSHDCGMFGVVMFWCFNIQYAALKEYLRQARSYSLESYRHRIPQCHQRLDMALCVCVLCMSCDAIGWWEWYRNVTQRNWMQFKVR